MSKVYSTEELIQILADERRACMSGQRLNLSVSPTGISPFIDQFLQPEGIQKFAAYNDFRATIHQYQRTHQVSGIIWLTIAIAGHRLHYPKVDDQLIALPDDLDTLKAAKPAILEFWQQVTAEMDLYLSLKAGKFYEQIETVEVDRIAQRTEWASLYQQGQSTCLEIILQLGWGQPEAATYRRGFPDSGSESIHAVHPGQQPLC